MYRELHPSLHPSLLPLQVLHRYEVLLRLPLPGGGGEGERGGYVPSEMQPLHCRVLDLRPHDDHLEVCSIAK